MSVSAGGMSIGIVGWGDFSKLMVRYLAPYADIYVTTRQSIDNAHGFNCHFTGPEEALAQAVVIPSIPAQFLEEFFTANGRYLKSGSLVADVCSVKVRPVEVLQRVLPESVDILATHPLFGPVSAADSVAGQSIMLHPVRLERHDYDKIKAFLRDELKLKLSETTPEEHDRAMAYVQGLSHYIGRTMDIMGIPETELATRAYRDLLDMKCIQGADSWDLFASIMQENPYAEEVTRQLKRAMAELDKRLAAN